MHPHVLERFRHLQSRDEGTVRYMYRDENGNVTTGIGFMLRSADSVNSLQWVEPSGSPAALPRVRTEWQEVHDRTRDRSSVLLHPDELARLSPSTRATIESLAKALASVSPSSSSGRVLPHCQ